MKLRSPVQLRSHRRDPHARANIPRQVDDSRAHVGFFLRHVRERRYIDGNKQERQTKALQHARPHRVPVIQPEVPSRHHKQRGRRYDAAKRNKYPGVYFGHQDSHHRHHAHDHRPAR